MSVRSDFLDIDHRSVGNPAALVEPFATFTLQFGWSLLFASKHEIRRDDGRDAPSEQCIKTDRKHRLPSPRAGFRFKTKNTAGRSKREVLAGYQSRVRQPPWTGHGLGSKCSTENRVIVSGSGDSHFPRNGREVGVHSHSSCQIPTEGT